MNIGKFQLSSIFLWPSFADWLSPQTSCTCKSPATDSHTILWPLPQGEISPAWLRTNILLLWKQGDILPRLAVWIGIPVMETRNACYFALATIHCSLRAVCCCDETWEPKFTLVFILLGRRGALFAGLIRLLFDRRGEINNPQAAAAKANSLCISTRGYHCHLIWRLPLNISSHSMNSSSLKLELV